jgi:hypothetical protein
MNFALVDDTVFIGAIREALKDRGFELEGFPPADFRLRIFACGFSPADFRQPNLSVLASAANKHLQSAGFTVCTTRLLIETAATTVRAKAVGPEKALLEQIIEKLTGEVVPIIFGATDAAGPQNQIGTAPLEEAISLLQPVLVITQRERLPYVPHLLLEPLPIGPKKWLVEAARLC